MEKQNQYFIKQRNGQVWRFYFDSNAGIMSQTTKNTIWSAPQTICKDGTKHFSVYLDRLDRIYVFCQKHSGDIVFFTLNQSEWEEKMILHSKTGKRYPIHFEAIQYRNQIHLFYNIVDTKSNHHVLIHQYMNERDEWTAPSVIDQIYPMSHTPFSLHKDWHNSLLIVYQAYKNDYQLGLRKYSLYHNKWDDFNQCDHTLFEYKDYDSLLSNQYFHIAYIKNDKNESTLIYHRMGRDWDKPMVLFANPKIDSCTIFLSKYILNIGWICEGKIYLSSSTDQGRSFSKPVIQGDVLHAPQKMFYQSNYPERIHASHLYMDTDQSLNALLYSNILPQNPDTEGSKEIKTEEDRASEEIQLASKHVSLDSNNIDYNKIQPDIVAKSEVSSIPSIHSVVQELHETIDSSKKILHQLESSVDSTDQVYKNKSVEINKLNIQLGMLQNRNEALMKKNQELRDKNNELQEKLAAQIKETKSLENQIIKNEHIIEYLKKEVELRKAPLIITAEDPRKRKQSSLVRRFLLGDDMERVDEE